MKDCEFTEDVMQALLARYRVALLDLDAYLSDTVWHDPEEMLGVIQSIINGALGEIKTINGLQCEECHYSNRWKYVEKIDCARQVVAINTEAKTLRVEGQYTTEGYDESGTDARLECGYCGSVRSLSAEFTINWI